MKKIIVATIAVVGLALSGASIANATDNTPELVERWWIVPAGVAPVDNRVGEEGFPQKPTTPGVVPCGQYAQIDWYPADAPIDEWLEDGVLTYGEDWGYVDQGHVWDFAYGGDCRVEEPPVTDEPDEPENTVPDVPVVDVPAKLAAPTAPAEIQTAAE